MTTTQIPDPPPTNPHYTMLTPQLRLQMYRTFGYTTKALIDKSEIIRLEAYNHFYPGNFPIETKTDESPLIRIEYYRQHGYEEDCKTDEYWKIRYEAYDILGGFDTMEAFYDVHWKISSRARMNPIGYNRMLQEDAYDIQQP